MVRLLNKELNDKLDNVVNYIKESNSYQNYLKAKELYAIIFLKKKYKKGKQERNIIWKRIIYK